LRGLVIHGNAGLLFTIGIILILAGVGFRFWSVMTLGRFFHLKIVIQEKHQLITSGPYRYLRNPSYTGVILTFIGFGIGIGNWLSLIILFARGLATFARRILFEDMALSKRFGHEYEAYQKKTWAIIPFIW
jgi:protein-S-isoprenylcysteine O-methyltransferase